MAKIVGLAEVALTIGLAIVTAGGSVAVQAAAKAGYAANKAALKTAAKESAQKVAANIAKNGYRTVVQNAVKNFKDKLVADLVQGMGLHLAAKYIEYSQTQTDALEERIAAKLAANDGDAASTAVQEFDPTGLGAALDSVTGDAVDDTAQVTAKWMNFVGTFDPTGALSAAASFIGDKECEVVDDAYQEAGRTGAVGSNGMARASAGGGGGGGRSGR